MVQSGLGHQQMALRLASSCCEPSGTYIQSEQSKVAIGTIHMAIPHHTYTPHSSVFANQNVLQLQSTLVRGLVGLGALVSSSCLCIAALQLDRDLPV